MHHRITWQFYKPQNNTNCAAGRSGVGYKVNGMKKSSLIEMSSKAVITNFTKVTQQRGKLSYRKKFVKALLCTDGDYDYSFSNIPKKTGKFTKIIGQEFCKDEFVVYKNFNCG